MHRAELQEKIDNGLHYVRKNKRGRKNSDFPRRLCFQEDNEIEAFQSPEWDTSILTSQDDCLIALTAPKLN